MVGNMANFIEQPVPTMYFFGVTTGESLSRRMFPAWAEILKLGDARLVGVDLPLDGSREQYRQAVYQIKADRNSLGAVVTTHKIRVLRAAADYFDELTADAELCGEVSSIYKRNGRLIGHTVDPETSGKAMKAFIPADHWTRHRSDILCLGAGGSAVALVTFFCTRSAPNQRPRRMILVNRGQEKLDNLAELLRRLPESGIAFDLVRNSDPAVNDGLMAELPPHSLVINATGMGKDIPGSPVTDRGLFPEHGLVWELNYRGKLDFLHQARAQEAARGLHVEDGWTYFLLGWSEIVGAVFDKPIDQPVFERLAGEATRMRDR